MVVLSRDLILASRIIAQATTAGHQAELVTAVSEIPPATAVDLLFINWADREAGWASALTAWRDGTAPGPGPRFILYGPHTDLEAHAAAGAAGFGPMLARSKLVAALPTMLGAATEPARHG